MTQQDLIIYAKSQIGLPYKTEAPFSITEGFNCFFWADHLFKLWGIDVQSDMKIDKTLRKKFKKLENGEEPRFLDIPLFYASILDTRHIGVMLDSTEMSHCSRATNGVATSDITRHPWKNVLKGIYRLK